MGWRQQAACLGATHLFYPEDGDQLALDSARAICVSCKVRKECAVDTLVDEATRAEDERYGVAAFMTPRQRQSLARRGTLRCACGHVRDPIDLVQGRLLCPRCTNNEVPPIPDNGDRWAKRHTTLARKVMAWFAENVGSGDQVPPPSKMAPMLHATLHDTMHVYHGLHSEGTLRREKSRYYRTARKGASWYEHYPNP